MSQDDGVSRLIHLRREVKPINYPAPDGKLSFDILTSVSLTGTNHAEGQASHLRLPDEEGARARHTETNVGGESGAKYGCRWSANGHGVVEYAGLLGQACPAAVYEYADAEGGEEDAKGKRFIINSQNCIHVSRYPSILGSTY